MNHLYNSWSKQGGQNRSLLLTRAVVVAGQFFERSVGENPPTYFFERSVVAGQFGLVQMILCSIMAKQTLFCMYFSWNALTLILGYVETHR